MVRGPRTAMKSGPRLPQLEKALAQKRRPNTAKNPNFIYYTIVDIKHQRWASLVAQWLRICLLMQGIRVRALVWEDPTCHGATGPVSHNY
ncbi:hypothetical protein J1605_022471 [Eschrichtius robustus]|uniref:Uncharacterized protein n=1 Tax=Eschrichtius robustus TaxID=9764 RepID=A0AB34H7F4_ESCRO|nr:hypothetical protein J1605_022471 [Eschrichtius robustus]